MDITPERIATAYQRLAEALEPLAECLDAEIKLREELEDVRFIETAQGKITGKNESEREGNFRLAHEDALRVLRYAEYRTRCMKLNRDLAQLGIDEIARIMRLTELAQTTAWVHGEATT